ncbi:LytR C-terminal domain-containing protein [Candidatus Microgenomates bacterium]|nr:LytR C-terminal domain-containing protein [Candidatus Microgenomates bacterium]
MIYLDLSDNSLEAIETSQNLIGGEKIIAAGRKDIPEGIIDNGLIADPDKLTKELLEIFSSSYPKEMKDKQIVVAISDKQVFTQRFSINVPDKETDISALVLEEAKKVLPYEPSELENFFKVINQSANSLEVLYTATPLTTIAHFGRFFRNMGLKMTFLSASSFSLFELLRLGISPEEKILYCTAHQKAAEYFVFDYLGPIINIGKKLGSKSLTAETKTVIKAFEEKHQLKFSKMIIGGTGSLEIQAKELQEEVELPVLKSSDVIDEVLFKLKISIETGGIPKMLFVNSLGLIQLTKSNAPSNFAKDFTSFDEVPPITASQVKEKPVISEGEKVETVSEKEVKQEVKQEEKKEEKKEEVSQYINESLVSYERPGLGKFLSKKIILIVITVIVALVVMFLLFSFTSKGKGGINIPFITQPTSTPTPTLVPSNTPTPTVDPKLKRSDLKVNVLNGTDKSGFAKETADLLEKAGYKNVGRGNADKDSYEKTVIQIKDDKKNYLPLIVGDLKDKFDTSTVESLDKDKKYDLIIILGKK